MKTNRLKKRVAVLAVGAATAALVPALATPSASAQTDTSVGAGGEYFPLTPERVLDTRDPSLDIAPTGAKPTDGDGETYTISIAGRAGVPAEDVLAVAVSVVAVGGDGTGFISVRPSGFVPSSDADSASLVNFTAGANVPNLAIVGLGTDGAIEIEVTTPGVNGDIHLLVDVYGWIATSAFDDADDLGSRVVSLTPARLMDTRNAAQLPPGMSAPRQMAANETLTLPIRGQGGVPDSASVSGVIVNLTGIRPNGRTFLALTPDGLDPASPSSTGNYANGEIRANMGIIPLADDGSISITNGGAPINVAVDVVGYLEQGVASDLDRGRVVPLEAPFRSFDTRGSEFGSVRLGQSQWEDWSFTKFAESVELDGVTNIAQQGFFANLAGTGLQNAGVTFLTLNPREPEPFGSTPGNSTLNVFPVGAASNMSLVRYGTNGDGDDAVVSAFNSEGSIHYLLDVYAVILSD